MDETAVLTTENLRAWAGKCAQLTHGRMAEYEAWERISVDGEEWQQALKPDGRPDHGTGIMKARNCFNNTARTVLGMTAMDPFGLMYAEGFALTQFQMWSHHAWAVTPDGLALDRTWKEPGVRYVGVVVDPLGSISPDREPGMCQLSDFALGFAWGPSMTENPEAYDKLWEKR